VGKNITGWIETHTSAFLESGLQGANKTPFEKVLHVAIPHRSDYLNAYVNNPGMMPDCLLCKQRSSMRAEAATRRNLP